jgi:hypothetical protein
MHSRKGARAAALAVALGTAVAALGACGGSKGGRSDYVHDADTGAAAPATQPTLDHPAAPDSTAGVSQRTGQPGVAGDTLGSKSSPAGTSAGAAASGTRKP